MGEQMLQREGRRGAMREAWVISETGVVLSSGEDAVAVAVRARDSGPREVLFESDLGRTLLFVTNGDRVMMVLMDEPGDPGVHVVDPDADGTSSGYVLSNGQVDEYADRDTVPWEAALRALRCVVDDKSSPVTWRSDR
jgi:hypothetical protein